MALNGSINLMKFHGAKKIIANGQKGIFIPVEDNPAVFVSENGAFVGIRVWERESNFGERHYTHAVSVSLPKNKREELETEGWQKDDIYAITPFIGNLEEREPKQGSGDYEEAVVSDERPAPTPSEDLPF